ncbi:Sortase family protein [Amycolatopsis arida]|uniref:Sortase family protein n=1 Tax=Amycolatopsis arida TaxID=587909 RepID=A0A1I5XI48_9PSEU|nr:sortase [Amycolatopsis arida]TDX97434.1 sortase family protein [Amycolatopsis arida]SFQ31624.1 Sortase family protein [Amycolatopsis arida]
MSDLPGYGRRGDAGRLAAVAAAVVVTLAAALTGAGLVLADARGAGEPHRDDGAAGQTLSTQRTATSEVVATAVALPASAPVALSMPVLDLHVDGLVELNRTPAGAMEIPAAPRAVGWFVESVTPGERGVAVLVGHIEFAHERGALHGLGRIRPGDTIAVTRADGTTAEFTVYLVRPRTDAADSSAGPAIDATVAAPELRLLTGGAVYDTTPSGQPDLVVCARLTGTSG